jgi:hypothetical protein
VELARAQVEALQSQVPTLVLALSASAPAGMVVERDGVVLQGAALGVALPIDPGEHVVVSRAPGVPEERLTLTIGIGDSKRIELPFRPLPPPVTAPPPAPPTTEKTARQSDFASAPPDDGSTQRTWGYVATGLGAAGLLVGSITGALVLDRKATVNDECPTRDTCSKEGKQAADSGQSLAAVSTIAFGVGLAGIATGVVLIVTAPDEKGHGAAWLSVTKRF